MAELADAADSKSADRKVVGVRPPLPAPYLTVFKICSLENGEFLCAQNCAQSVPGFSLTGIGARSRVAVAKESDFDQSAGTIVRISPPSHLKCVDPLERIR